MGAINNARSITHQGVRLTVEYEEIGDRVIGFMTTPSGVSVSYEIYRSRPGGTHSNLWSHGDNNFCGPGDHAAADRLFPFVPGEFGTFRRATPDLIAATWAAVAQEARTPRNLAQEAARRVTDGTRKEDWLPFVTAVLQWLTLELCEAFDRDDTGATFDLEGERVKYLADFRRLTGRDFDREADAVTWEEIEAL